MEPVTKDKQKSSVFMKINKTLLSIPEMGILLTLIAMIIIMSCLSKQFFTFANIMSVLRQISITCIVAVGLAYVLICGEFDLSTSAALAFGGILCAYLYTKGVPISIAVLIAMIGGLLIGLANSVLVVKLGINAFIATMATQNIIKGFTYLMTSGYTISVHTRINFLGNGTTFGVPNLVIIMLIIVIIGDIVLNHMVFGKNVLAVGGNKNAAKMSGIPVFWTKASCFAICGVLCVVAGILNSFNLSVADTAAGSGSELEYMAAVVIGGTPMDGGRGSIRGVIIGGAIMGVIKNAFVMLHVSNYWQTVSLGIIILLAVLSHKLHGRRTYNS